MSTEELLALSSLIAGGMVTAINLPALLTLGARAWSCSSTPPTRVGLINPNTTRRDNVSDNNGSTPMSSALPPAVEDAAKELGKAIVKEQLQNHPHTWFSRTWRKVAGFLGRVFR